MDRFLATQLIDSLIENHGYTDNDDEKIEKLVKIWKCKDLGGSKTFLDHEFRPYPHFIVYDFEARMEPLDRKSTDDLTYIAKHVPVSVSIHDTLNEEPIWLTATL